MKKIFIFLSLIVIWIGAHAQQPKDIVYLEYEFDQFPAYNKGKPITLSSTGNDIAQQLTLPLTGLNQGVHDLYIRVKNNSGVWSLTHILPVYVSAIVNTDISRLEYYFDNYMLPGKGTKITINGTDKYLIPLTGLQTGLHVLYVRSQNSKREWSILSQNLVNVVKNETPIVSIKYYFTGTGTTSQTFIKQINSASNDITAELIADNSLFENNKAYTLHAWAINSKGESGYESTLQFTYKKLTTGIDNLQSGELSVYPNPTADYIYIKDGSSELANSTYYIYNSMGVLCLTGELASNKIDVQGLPIGEYILFVKQGSTYYKGRITKL